VTPILAIADVLRVAADTILGLPGFTVHAKQNAPRPSGDYGVLDFVTSVGRGWEQSVWSDAPADTSKQDISGYREATFTFITVGAEAQDNARKLRIGFIRETINDLLRAANLGLLTRTPVLEIATPLENGWEERSTFDISVSAIGTDEDIVNCILSVLATGTYEFPSGTFTENISIP
jgi:hypothetical protein